MIVIDTNVIDKKAPTDPSVEMLVALAGRTGHLLYLPSVAWEEYSAHVTRELNTAYESLLARAKALERLAPRWQFDAPGSPAETAAMEQNTRLRDRFIPIPTPDHAPAEGLRREIAQEPPAADGGGARDTAIWLTALAQMAGTESPEELLIFYSKNHKDFGEGISGRIHPSLWKDVVARLGHAASRFRYCADLDSLLGVLDASRTSVADSKLESVAASPILRNEMLSALNHPSVYFDLTNVWSRGLGTLRSGSIQSLELREWKNQHRIRFAGIEYLVFAGTWSAEKLFSPVGVQPGDVVTHILVTFEVDATIVATVNSRTEIDAADVDGLTAPRDLHAAEVTQSFAIT